MYPGSAHGDFHVATSVLSRAVPITPQYVATFVSVPGIALPILVRSLAKPTVATPSGGARKTVISTDTRLSQRSSSSDALTRVSLPGGVPSSPSGWSPAGG